MSAQFLIVKNTQVTDVQLVIMVFYWLIGTVILKILTANHMISSITNQFAINVLVNTIFFEENANLLKKDVLMILKETANADLLF